MSSIRETVQASDDRAEVLVDVPEWEGVKLLLISPTSTERAAMIKRYTTEDGTMRTAEMMPNLIVACAHDPETRELAFLPTDVGWLGDKNGAVVEKIGLLCMPLCGFVVNGDESATDSGKGDSSTTQDGGTASDSPGISVAL